MYCAAASSGKARTDIAELGAADDAVDDGLRAPSQPLEYDRIVALGQDRMLGLDRFVAEKDVIRNEHGQPTQNAPKHVNHGETSVEIARV